MINPLDHSGGILGAISVGRQRQRHLICEMLGAIALRIEGTGDERSPYYQGGKHKHGGVRSHHPTTLV
ncbi:MAG: hypothetical protein AAGD25_18900 [Cyanobacteria bacterium P01_F01_bin.150]